MTIYRDGKAIRLTEQELSDAYFEQEFIFDMEDLQREIEDMIEDGDFPEDVNEAMLAAKLARRYRDELDYSQWYRDYEIETARRVIMDTVGR